jgi:phage-related protein
MRRPVANVGAVVPKSVIWVGSSRENLKAFPEPVQKGVGYGLWFAQIGSKHPHAKVLRGFGGAGVVEIIEDWDGNTYRAVYTVKFSAFVYVLHCFQKKSKRGAQTPSADVALIRSRLRLAEADYQARKEAK